MEETLGCELNDYTYTFTTTGDTVIAVVIGGSPSEQDTLFVKVDNTWKAVSRAWKKSGSTWSLQADVTTFFDPSKQYVRG